jgi:hypothetical protein
MQADSFASGAYLKIADSVITTGLRPLDTAMYVDTYNQYTDRINTCAEFNGAWNSITTKNGEMLSPHFVHFSSVWSR